MKRFLYVITVIHLCCVAVTVTAHAEMSGEKVTLVVDGEALKKDVRLYALRNDNYFSLREIAPLFGGRLLWHPITGKVSFLVNNKKMDFFVKSTKVTIENKTKRLSAPNHLIDGKLFVMADFIFSQEFASFTETESHWNPDTKILVIEKRVNVAPPRYYSDAEATRIELEFSEKLPYAIDTKKPGRIFISIPRGIMEKENIKVDDGVVKEIDIRQRGREAYMTIYLTAGAGRVSEKYIEDQLRLELEVRRTALSGELPQAKNVEPPKPITGLTVVNTYFAFVFQSTSVLAPVTTVISEEPIVKEIKKEKAKKILVLDAGHGGDDPGALGSNGSKEKDINLAIVKELQRLFEKDPENCFDVVLTREDDTFIPLVERTNIANQKKADLFVSIHCNASIKQKTNGFEVYFLSEKASDPEAQSTAILENSVVVLEGKPSKKREMLQELLWSMVINEFINESSELCYLISDDVTKRIQIENRGVKQAGFHVLKGAQMPAALVECAFISNLEGEAHLRNRKYQKKMADAIFSGIKKYDRRKQTLNAKN